jgi:hypothetical protein
MIDLLSFARGGGYRRPVLVLERELEPPEEPDERLLLPLLPLLLPLLLLYEEPLLELPELLELPLLLLYELLLEELLLLLLEESFVAGVDCR